MNLQSISSSSSSSDLSIFSTQPTGSTSTVSGTSGSSDDGGQGSSGSSSGSVSMSGPGKIFSQLQALEKSDPAKAKQVLSGIADKLRADAKNGGANADKLDKLADKFQKAADSGDISSLVPASPHHGGAGGKHHHAKKAYGEHSGDSDSGGSVDQLLEQELSSLTGNAATGSATSAATSSLSSASAS